MNFHFVSGLMVAIKNGTFLAFATNFGILSSTFWKLRVSHTQISCYSLCLTRCMRDSMPGLYIHAYPGSDPAFLMGGGGGAR